MPKKRQSRWGFPDFSKPPELPSFMKPKKKRKSRKKKSILDLLLK